MQGELTLGIGIQALQLTAQLWKDGFLKNFKRVIEIGSQDIRANQTVVGEFLIRLVGSRPAHPVVSAEDVYKLLGFEEYKCIDMDGRHDALAFDLNKNISATYGYTKKFDLVTNHGTTEHVFDQATAFLNIHNLCAEGGIMLHALPFQGYINHGFYNYQPGFYRDLAAANNYSMIGMFLNIDRRLGDLTPYSDDLMKFLHVPPGTDMALFVVLKKVTDQEFRASYDAKFAKSFVSPKDYQYPGATMQFFPGDRNPRSNKVTDVYTMPPRRIVRVLFRRAVHRLFRKG